MAAQSGFAEWIKTGNTTEIKWKTSVEAPVLQMNQRVTVRYSATKTVKNLEPIKADRELVFLFRADRVGSVVDSRRPFIHTIPIPKDAARGTEILFDGIESLQPGDYDFRLAVYDSATKKHSIQQHRVHISAIPDDPLPQLQFPGLPGKAALPVSNKRPLTVDLISLDHYYSDAFDILAQMKLTDSVMSAAVLNIEKQQVIFDQQDVRQLDLRRLNQARASNINEDTIDMNVLLAHKKEASFLRDYLRQRLETSSTRPRVVILLSGQRVFPDGNDLSPLLLEKECECRIFHLLTNNHMTGQDEVQRLLKRVQLRRFEIETPMDLRRALAAIVQELEGL